jgi:hypothetical protein
MSQSTVAQAAPRLRFGWVQGLRAMAKPPGGEDRAAIGPWERAGQVLMLALLIIGLPMAYQTAIDSGPDLAGFCDAGRYILEHGTRDPDSTLARYWPSADVPWIALCLLPIRVVAVLWYGVGCIAWLGLLRTICKGILVGESFAARRHATLTAGLLAMPFVIDGMRMGSFHVLMVWLMIMGLDRACRGRAVSGGILLGTAAWLKLLPLMGIGFLLYQRKWLALLIAMAAVVVLEVGLSLAAFGPAGAWNEHVRWWKLGAAGTTDRQLASVQARDEDRLTNQSVAITLRRLLTSLGNKPRSEAQMAAVPAAARREQVINFNARRRVQLADFTPAQLRAAYLAALAILAAGVAFYCRPVRGAAWADKGPAKIAMMTLATIWFSPVVWSYHFVTATPVLAILLLRGRYRWQCVVPVILVWAGALGLLYFDTVRAAGVLLWMSLLLGAGLVVFPAETDTVRP